MFSSPHRRLVSAPAGGELITKQECKDECDINKILKQYKKTGIITHVQNNRGDYTDLPDAMDYQESMNIIIEAQDTFDGLPSKVRDYFHNDPQQFLAAFADPQQEDKLREFGLLKAKPADPSPVRVRVVPDVPSAGGVPGGAPGSAAPGSVPTAASGGPASGSPH